MLHSPRHPDMLAILPSLVKTHRRALEVFQATHSAHAERALKKGRPYVASFVKAGADSRPGRSRMLFAGLYRNRGWQHRSHCDIWADPDVRWLAQTFGACSEFEGGQADKSHVWFDLEHDAELEEWQGRLVVSVRLTPNYVRRAENLEAPVCALHSESAFDTEPPDWRDLTLRAALVRVMPPGWATRLREWRGIYLIVDERDGARYVGSAYGETNLLGRWQQHVVGDTGVTVELSKRDPGSFRFSILERVSPDMPIEDVVALEQTWMTRLHTKEFGLNT